MELKPVGSGDLFDVFWGDCHGGTTKETYRNQGRMSSARSDIVASDGKVRSTRFHRFQESKVARCPGVGGTVPVGLVVKWSLLIGM